MEIYAWVLMPNHFHILCKTKNLPLAVSMRRILTGYVVNFNRRHRRYGHLFQNRYKSIVCQEGVYLKELVRYIYLHPVKFPGGPKDQVFQSIIDLANCWV